MEFQAETSICRTLPLQIGDEGIETSRATTSNRSSQGARNADFCSRAKTQTQSLVRPLLWFPVPAVFLQFLQQRFIKRACIAGCSILPYVTLFSHACDCRAYHGV